MNLNPCGLFSVLATPFSSDGDLDRPSLARLVEFNLTAGAAGLVALGVAGESAFLSEEERRIVVGDAVAHAAGRPVVVGVSNPDTAVAAQCAKQAAEMKASAVMVAVPADLSALIEHVTAVANAAYPLGVIVQDYPHSGHPQVSAEDLADLTSRVSSIVAVKAEDPPTPAKIRHLSSLVPHMHQLGGLGGLYGFWELKAGASGLMTGFSYPERLVQIIKAARDENWSKAQQLFEALLPVLVWESQPGVGVGLRKLLLNIRGVIDSATTRAPTGDLQGIKSDAHELVETMGYSEI